MAPPRSGALRPALEPGYHPGGQQGSISAIAEDANRRMEIRNSSLPR